MDDTTFSVGWVSLALINAGLAQSKNRSGLAWSLLSLLLGPFATFLLVAFCDTLEPQSERATRQRRRRDRDRERAARR